MYVWVYVDARYFRRHLLVYLYVMGAISRIVTFYGGYLCISVLARVVYARVSLIIYSGQARASPIIFQVGGSQVILHYARVGCQFGGLVLGLGGLRYFLGDFFEYSDCSDDYVSGGARSLIGSRAIVQA